MEVPDMIFPKQTKEDGTEDTLADVTPTEEKPYPFLAMFNRMRTATRAKMAESSSEAPVKSRKE
jgi:hypothetical protein